MGAVRSVVIVGGGTAGWLTAGIIAARHQARIKAGSFSVTLVESPDVRIIGVGEGTWPTIRATLSRMGISETALFRECDAAFKQGGEFAGWATGAADDRYYHPLMLPHGFSQLNLVPHWLRGPGGRSFCDFVTPQGRLCEAGLAPKTITHAEYRGPANYAYHLDAGKFAPFLARHCTEKLAVRHVLADITEVRQRECGDIESLLTRQAGAISADLFVDCSGFSALLIGKTLGVPFRSCSDILFCDTALAVQVPFGTADAPLASHTIATAHEAGWTWDICLPTRRGVGYVYSSGHCSEEQARETLLRYIGTQHRDLPVRKIPIRAGHRESFWKHNCVAIGLASGFLEPLESSSIVLVELSAKLLAEQMPVCREVMDIVARRFNDVTTYRFGRIIDFLKLHYVLTRRTDTAFWRDNVERSSVPGRLRDLLTLWTYQSPWFFDELDRLEEVFPAASYQYVLYGMGFRTEVVPEETQETATTAARLVRENDQTTGEMRAGLPKNRELLNKIYQYGLQPV
ncbi:MAG TPA: tryptophan halogenase family protein [Steroidobacteraceae bacterium]|nr:tryptophan halogenase family protein [Steroidobacteraceae bacterium]